MATQIFFPIFLMLHLTGFVLLAGTTIIDFVTLQQFWKQYEQDPPKANAVLQALSKFPLLLRMGIAAIVVSGVGMMALTHGLFGEQLWFRIKFGIVVLVILNALLVGRQLALKLIKHLNNTAVVSEKLTKIKSNLNWFHSIQLVLLFAILLLSVFKFD